MKFTTREKRLLYLLLLVVLLAGIVLVTQSFSERNAVRAQQLTELQSESARVRAACEGADELQTSLDELQTEAASLEAEFMPSAANAYIDDKITALAADCGLTTYALVLEDAVNTSVPYFGSSAEDGALGGIVWVSQSSFTAAGRESALLAFLDAAQADPSLHVRSFTYTGTRGGTLQIQFSLDVYMVTAQTTE
ncbi:MAG: hypothetical protein VB092_05140 [Oscillospiraceae bacterium]|nr:hypothetical protein [Oscillospiraceae bacterium]